MDWTLIAIQVLTALISALVAIIVAAIPVVVPIVVNRLLDKWKVEADAERRKALTTAIINGLTGALDMRGLKKEHPITPQQKVEVMVEAAEYAQKTVPQTIEKLGVPQENLVESAKTHPPQVLGTFGPLGTVIGTIGPAVIDTVGGPSVKRKD